MQIGQVNKMGNGHNVKSFAIGAFLKCIVVKIANRLISFVASPNELYNLLSFRRKTKIECTIFPCKNVHKQVNVNLFLFSQFVNLH